MRPMTQGAGELSAEIIRCPVVERCLSPGGEREPCYRAATWRGKGELRFLPELWMGISTALRYCSSTPNPGADEEGVTPTDDE